MLQNLQNFAKFQKFQLDNLVDFEKCCKTHIFFAKIGADTAEHERKFAKCFSKNWQLPEPTPAIPPGGLRAAARRRRRETRRRWGATGPRHLHAAVLSSAPRRRSAPNYARRMNARSHNHHNF